MSEHLLSVAFSVHIISDSTVLKIHQVSRLFRSSLLLLFSLFFPESFITATEMPASRHVMIFFRHGDRSPITGEIGSKYVMDETEKQYWIDALPTPAQHDLASASAKVMAGSEEALPGGVFPNGQLTSRGAVGVQEKGQKLRERYQDLMVDIQPSEIYLRSTNITRTNLSAQFFMAGFAPECLHDIQTDAARAFAPHGQIDFNAECHKFRATKNVPEMDIPLDELDTCVRQAFGIPASELVPWTSGKSHFVVQ